MPGLSALLGFVLAPLALAAGFLSLDLPLALPVEPYADGTTPVYLDRPYVNEEPARALAGLRIVRVPRHLYFPLELELAAPARVLRLLSDENDNTPFGGWEPVAGLRVNVPGRSCVLTHAVAKELPAGRHALLPGGPVAAAPLLVASAGAVHARTTRAWNKLQPGAGPVELVLRNKTKLGGLALAYAGWCWAFQRMRRRWRPAP